MCTKPKPKRTNPRRHGALHLSFARIASTFICLQPSRTRNIDAVNSWDHGHRQKYSGHEAACNLSAIFFISELLPIIDVFARAPRTSPITTDTSQLWIRSFTSSHNIHNQNQFPFAPSAWSWRRYRPPPWTWTSLSRGGYSWLEKKIVGGSEKMRHHRIQSRWRSLACDWPTGAQMQIN